MKKINIISQNEDFAEDLSSQIIRVLPEAEVNFAEKQKNADLYIIDENEDILPEISKITNSAPIVFLSSTKDAIEYADIVIRKPFSLLDFLKSLKENTLLPRVRRKECITFKEYNLYPVKKEIVSSTTQDIIKLTEKEVEILKYLYTNAPSIMSKEDLLENVWGYCADMTTHTIETHIYRLRQKIEQYGGSQVIITENNGYRLNI